MQRISHWMKRARPADWLNRVKKLDNLDYYQTMLQEIDEL